jgi:EmrB/QacA subfamily drug resistance transporter
VTTEGRRLAPGQGWVLALSSVASFMVSLDSQVVATALPVIRVQLHASLAALEWTVNAYTLSFAVLLMTGSALGERFGRRRMLAAGIGLFGAASVVCALAPDVGVLVAARAVQGAGAAVVLPTALALLSAGFPPQRRAWAIGIFSSVTGLAVVSGPVVGGAVAQGLAWQWIFWLNVPLGVIMLPLVLTKLADGSAARARLADGSARLDPVRLDLAGLVLVTGAALSLVWALIRAGDIGWGSPEIVATLAGGFVLGALFAGWELRAVSPMVPPRLFRLPAFAAGNAAGLCLFAGLFGMVFFMAQFLQTGLGYGPFGAGLRLVPGWVLLALIAPFAGTLIRRFGERMLIAGGLTMLAAGLTWMGLIARTGLPYPDMIAPLVLAGAGASLVVPSAQSVVMTAVSPADIGKASGTFNMLRQLGAVFGIAICAAVFTAHGGYRSPAAFISGFGPAMYTCAGVAVAGAMAGLLIPRRRAAVAPPSAAESPAPETTPAPGTLASSR